MLGLVGGDLLLVLRLSEVKSRCWLLGLLMLTLGVCGWGLEWVVVRVLWGSLLRDLRRDPDSKTSKKTSKTRTQISIDSDTSWLRYTDTETHSSKEIKGVAEIRLREGGLIGDIVWPWLRLV